MASAAIDWSGTRLPVIEEKPAASTGLEAVYVAHDVVGLTVTYSGDGAADAVWSKFSSLGGAYAEEVGRGPSIVVNEGDLGYIVHAAGRDYAFWLVDYSRHPLTLRSISAAPEQDCGQTALTIDGSGDQITYYSITGRPVNLGRDLTLSYRNLEWDENAGEFREQPATRTVDYVHSPLIIPAAYCSTDFTLSGDRFLKVWGEEESVTSSIVPPHSVEGHTQAEQQERDADNEVASASTGTFGGSAPCTVSFSAHVTDAAIFHEWQISKYQDFDDIELRFSELDFEYTFIEEGTRYVRFYCANADASCDWYSDVYDVSIGTSSLHCPNAFSPFNEDGVNDLWKVSYSSIVKFDCHIFNRNGREMCSFSDPSQGWDGKFGGKFVPTGVYFYVITATGADGKNYKLSGDINIVDYK